MVAEELMRSGFDRAMHAGVVLTGGGSMLEGMPEIAEEALDVPVRRGEPQRLAGLTDTIATAQYGTAVGLTLYGTRSTTVAGCTWTINSIMIGTLNGDTLTGDIQYTPSTNGSPDCASIEGCISRQEFNGVRAPQ